MFIKKFIPRSLLSRFLMIIITPMVLVQLIAAYVFYQRHWSSVSSHMAAALAGEVAILANLQEHSPAMELRARELMAKYLDMRTDLIEGKTLEPMAESLPDELDSLRQEIENRIALPFAIRYINNGLGIQIEILFKEQGKILRAVSSHKRLNNPTTTIFIMWMTGAATLLMGVAILFLRNQIRSISRLAQAAEKFGKGQEITGFKPEGAEEVRKAATAFLKMKARIERQIAQRTEMLAGVSHDLRTPLTRMKLQLAMLDQQPEIQEMQSDILEMEHMIHDYLEFAKGEGTEVPASCSLPQLVRGVIDGYRHQQHPIRLHASGDIMLILRVKAIKRALTNIIDNAIRYGTHVDITLQQKGGAYAVIIIDDDGVGIEEEKREIVFKPFYRLDSSRQLKTGSIGLGLAIARDIINGHGGDITLSESPDRGLRVTIRIPI